jgi:hypothetical protein
MVKKNGVKVIKIKKNNDNGYKLDLVRKITKTTLVINYQLKVLLFVFINDKHEYSSIPEEEVMKIRSCSPSSTLSCTVLSHQITVAMKY